LTAQRGLIDGEVRSDLQARSLATNPAPAAAKPKGDTALGGSNSRMAMNEGARATPASPPLQKSFAANVPPPPSAAGSFAQRHLPLHPEAEPMAREQARSSSRDELTEKKTRALELDKQ